MSERQLPRNDPAEVQATAEEVREMREKRVRTPRGPALSVPGVAGSGDIGLPPELRNFDPGQFLIPVEEADYKEKFDHQEQARIFDAEKLARAQAALDQEAADYQYFLRCRFCNGHGIYFVKPVSPGQTMAMPDWVARYKPKPEAFWDRLPLCQMCLQQGQEAKLDVILVDEWKRTWRPEEAMVWKIHRDPIRARFEGNFRAFLSRFEANNSFLPDLEKRRAMYREFVAEQKKQKEIAHA